jgi:S-methylmethionine-dependent homocysteine/selenocysteine methylase/SAM-dependent methyltransferase
MRLDAGLSASRFQRSGYDAVRAAFASQRCVLLDGREEIATAGDIAARHRRYVTAGCDVLGTGAWEPAPAGRHTADPHWMDVARRGVRLAREAIAEAGREGEVAVAFVLDAGIVNPDGPETVDLLRRALSSERPDLILIEGLTVVRAPIYQIVDGLRTAGYPVWLSFQRCPEGLCDRHGRHWGGPDGDEFGRAAHRFEQIGVDALLVNGIPHDHVDGTVTFLRDYTDLPLGVVPNAPPEMSAGDFAELAKRWRAEGAQLVGGAAGVGPEHIAAAGFALCGAPAGAGRRLTPVPPPAEPPAPWLDAHDRALYPLDFPDLISHDDVCMPSQGSLLIWRHLFRERAGRGQSCLDIGCGSGLQAIQLARNGGEHVHAIDVSPEAAALTLTNAFRNGVSEVVTAEATDLYAWTPDERYDVIVASLFQTPVSPHDPAIAHRPPDFWGRNAFDHVLSLLPDALAGGGVAYLLQLSILSQERTAALLERRGLRARVADFGFLPWSETFQRSAEQIARVERLSDAHHHRIAGSDMTVAYLLEITRAP